MKNTIRKSFNYGSNDLGVKVLFIVEVLEQGIFEGNNCTWVLTRENFYSKKSFLTRLPQLVKIWGDKLQIKMRVANKFKKVELKNYVV